MQCSGLGGIPRLDAVHRPVDLETKMLAPGYEVCIGKWGIQTVVPRAVEWSLLGSWFPDRTLMLTTRCLLQWM